jgi:hypothetical protein
VTQIDAHAALIFGTVGRPPREALGYRDGAFVTPAALALLGAEPNSVVELRDVDSRVEARIFPIVEEGRRDTTLYIASSVREALGVEAGAARVEVVALGPGGQLLGPPETELPPCGEPGAWAFQRVGLPPRESLELGDAVFVRSDVLERMTLAPGSPARVTVGASSIDVAIHPLSDDERRETSIYIRGSLRERLGIEEGLHQVAVRALGPLGSAAGSASGEATAPPAPQTEEDEEDEP